MVPLLRNIEAKPAKAVPCVAPTLSIICKRKKEREREMCKGENVRGREGKRMYSREDSQINVHVHVHYTCTCTVCDCTCLHICIYTCRADFSMTIMTTCYSTCTCVHVCLVSCEI